MNKIKEILQRYELIPKQMSYQNHTRMIQTDQGKYVVKIKNREKEPIYEYLKNRNFSHFLSLENNYQDPYEIYPYIEDKVQSKEDKAIDLIYIISILHTKTTTYEQVNIDETKKIYEETQKKIAYLNSYYLDMQDYIETKIHMSPAEYLLIRNMSLIYSNLIYAKEKLENWYQEKMTTKIERKVLIHNNITLDHFIEEKNQYLINWDHAKKDYVIYDFLKFFENEYQDLEMESLFNLYQSKYQYTKDEKLLFLSLLAIPPKIELKNTNYINTLKVRKMLLYIMKARQITLKDQEKNRETKQQEFE